MNGFIFVIYMKGKMLQYFQSKYLLPNIYILINSFLGFALLLTDLMQNYNSVTNFTVGLLVLFFTVVLIVVNIVKVFGKEELDYTETLNCVYLFFQVFQLLIAGIGIKFLLGPLLLLTLFRNGDNWNFDFLTETWKFDFQFMYDIEGYPDIILGVNLVPLVVLCFNYFTRKYRIEGS